MLLGILCAMLVPGELPLRAQSPDAALTMEVVLAWEGYVRHSWWTEARVMLRNEGADWRGDLVIRDAQNQVTYRQALELPSHSYKQYRLPLFVGNSAMPSIALHDANNIVQQEARVPIRGSDATGRMIALVDTREAFARGRLAESDTLVWLPDLTGLPETPMAWDVIDVLLLNGIPTADLTPAQQEALLAWVAAGGHCIVGGGPALGQTLAYLPEALRIAAPGSVRQFTSIAVEGAIRSDVAAAPLTLHAGATPLVAADKEIIAARRAVGKGTMDIVGWDMAHPADVAWLTQLWSSDPLPAVSMRDGDQAFSPSNPNVSALFRIPVTMIPTFWPWLLLFPLYIFLMGPGTLLLVRRLKRPILAWVFIPVWIFGAIVILALGLSSAFSQTFPLVHEIAMISVPDATLPARVTQGTAIYAPRIRRLTWHTDGLPRPLFGSYRSDNWYNVGDPFPVEARVTDARTTLQTRNPLGIITWGTEGLYDSPDIATDLQLTLREDGALYLTGEVWSEAVLHDAALLMGNAAYGITLTECIMQGATAVVSRPMTATYAIYEYSASFCGQTSYTPYGTYPSAPTAYSSPPATSCYLSGLLESVPFPAQGLNGAHHQESCLIYTVPCPTQPPGKLTIALEVVTNKVENGWIDKQTNIVYAYTPAATLHYALPVYIQIREIETLTVALQPAPEVSSSDPLKIVTALSVWNWDEQTWMDYLPSGTESSQLYIVLTGATARQAFDAQEGTRVRINTRDGVTAKLILTLAGAP